MTGIFLADDADTTRACWPVMRQLRPHLTEAEFFAQVGRQREAAGYRLAYVQHQQRVVAVAGFRIAEFLAWGRILYVDDLVTDEAHRGNAFGGTLLAWLAAHAKEQGCAQLHLDSGVQRFGAHRFYLTQRMDITSHHFALKL